jgi:hypothetical protein
MTQNQILSIFKQKKKEKQIETGRGPAKRPAGRPTYAQPTRAPRARALLSAWSLTSGSRSSGPPLPSLRDADGATPPVSCVLTVHGGSAMAPAAVGEGFRPSARAHRLHLDFATPWTPSIHALPYPFHVGHEKGGRPPWPTIGRPLGPGRVQTDGLASFHGG